MKQKIFDILDSLNIEYSNYEHMPVFSCDEAKGIDIPGYRVKSLLLRNKKATNYYMVVLPDNKKLDTNLLRELFSETKLSFASEDRMIEKIGVRPGSVSPFALIHNTQKDISLVIDGLLEGQMVGFHPLQNDNTIVLAMDSLEHFLEEISVNYSYCNL